MATFVQVNFFKTTISAAITSSDISISLGSTTGAPTIPSGDYWPLVLESNGVYELVYGTALSGSTLTVLRGQESSSAQAWVSGTTIMGAFSAGSLFYSGQLVADAQVPQSAVTQYETDLTIEPTQVPGLDLASGTFTGSFSGPYSSSIDGAVNYDRVGNIVTLYLTATVEGTSTTAAAITVSGLPSEVNPSTSKSMMCVAIIDSNAGLDSSPGMVTVQNSGKLYITPESGIFSSSGTVGISTGFSITYSIG